MTIRAIAVLSLVLTGCEAAQEPHVEKRMLDSYPVSRFVVAGSREYSNGKDIYILDTRYGDVCTYFMSNVKGEASRFEGCVHQIAQEVTPYFYKKTAQD